MIRADRESLNAYLLQKLKMIGTTPVFPLSRRTYFTLIISALTFSRLMILGVEI